MPRKKSTTPAKKDAKEEDDQMEVSSTPKSPSKKEKSSRKKKTDETPSSPTRKSRRRKASDAADNGQQEKEPSTPTRSSSRRTRSASRDETEKMEIEEAWEEAKTPSKKSRSSKKETPKPKASSSKKEKSARKSSRKTRSASKDDAEDDHMEVEETAAAAKDVVEFTETDEKAVETPKKKSKSSKKQKTAEKKASSSKKSSDKAADDEDAEDEAVETPKSNKKQKIGTDSSAKKPNETTPDGKAYFNPPPMPVLDVHIHRLRHLQYHPTAVTAMAATQKDGYVAISRQDGSFQLKTLGVLEEFRGRYIPHLTTVAEIPPPVQETPALVPTSMCFVESKEGPPSCVCAGPSGNLWMIDWEHSQMTSIIQSGGGGVFDLVTCQSSSGESGVSLPLVAAACQDGSVRIWKVGRNSHDTDLAMRGDVSEQRATISDPPLCTVPSMGAPILSLAWRLVSQKEKQNSSGVKSTVLQTVIFAAVADGTIRKYQIDIVRSDYGSDKTSKKQSSNARYSYKVGKMKSILRMTVESKGRRTATKVWSLQLLSDGTLIAGNSLGQVQFWNSQTGTLQQTVLQSSLQADVLKIVATPDESKVFCSGVDSRVVCIARAASAVGGGAPSQWKLTNVQRPHSHDVKAMVVLPAEKFENASSEYSMPRRLGTLITGGVDTKVCSYMVEAFGEKRPQQWYPWPMQSPISTSSNSSPPKLLSMQRRDTIDLYELETIPDDTIDRVAGKNEEQKRLMGPHRFPVKKSPESALLGTIQLDGASGIPSARLLASRLSFNGKFLAVSNGLSVFVFYLERVENKDGDLEIRPIKMQLPETLQNVNATALHFWGNLLCVADSKKRELHTVLLRWNEESRSGDSADEMRHSTILIPEAQHQHKGEIRLPIQSIETSLNGRMLVVLSHTRDGGVNVYQRVTDNSEYRHEWTVPKLGGYDARPAASTFVMKNKLALATYQSHVYVFNVNQKRLSSWSENYGFPVQTNKWTEDLLCRKDFPVRLMVNPKHKSQLIIASFGTFSVMSLLHKVPRLCRTVPEKHLRRRQQRTPDADDEDPWLKPRVSKPVTDDDEDKEDSPSESVEESGRKRKRADESATRGSRNCSICLQYNGMLYLNFVGQKEMVVVEQPWLEVVETLPDALQRRIYGTN